MKTQQTASAAITVRTAAQLKELLDKHSKPQTIKRQVLASFRGLEVGGYLDVAVPMKEGKRVDPETFRSDLSVFLAKEGFKKEVKRVMCNPENEDSILVIKTA